MTWEIKLATEHVEYENCGEIYSTKSIFRVDRKIHFEPSAGYQEPEDQVIEDIYKADSEHGLFEWVVTARLTGFNSHAEIDDIQAKEPEHCEILNQPSFFVE